MNCHEVHARMYRYLDREMTPLRRVWIAWHLRRCPLCAGGAEFERRLRARIANGCVDPIPQEFHERLVTFLRHAEGLEAGGSGPGG
jgi:mycothiol system anti-sigma-R factor